MTPAPSPLRPSSCSPPAHTPRAKPSPTPSALAPAGEVPSSPTCVIHPVRRRVCRRLSPQSNNRLHALEAATNQKTLPRARHQHQLPFPAKRQCLHQLDLFLLRDSRLAPTLGQT